MFRGKSNNRKAAYYPSSSQYLWRLTLLAAALALGVLILGSWWRHEIASQTLGVTPTSVSEIASQTPGVTPTSVSYLPLISKHFPPARTYYVDSSLGSDGNSCTSAQDPATPKRTVSGVMSCDPGPGEVVRFRGVFMETIIPPRSGTVLYDVQNIARVEESIVIFPQSINGLNPDMDYVTIYGSRKGNSGAFAVVSVSGISVTVDTSDLPATQFLSETASDPGDLQAAILRPVHFTAWEKDNRPVFNSTYQTFYSNNQSVLMVSYLHSISGENNEVWPAFEIDSMSLADSDYIIFDHLEVENAAVAVATEARFFRSNYDIIQHNNFHHIGWQGGASDEVIYFGYPFRPDLHHDYVQIMYNKIGPHRQESDGPGIIQGDGIELKESAHNATVFGNEVVGIQPNGCADAPIRSSAAYAFIANNYVHDIFNSGEHLNDPGRHGCGISIIRSNPLDEINGTILVNNIVANIKEVGIKVVDADDVQVLNNVVYNVIPKPDCGPNCMETSAGILFQNWQGSTQNIVVKNNIVQAAYIGIGRYIWSNDYPVSIDSDYNIVFDSEFPFRGGINQNAHDLVVDPGLVDPQNHNFALMATSPARDSGTDLTSVFNVDNHDAADPSLPAITAPIIRTGVWDRGAYEYEETQFENVGLTPK